MSRYGISYYGSALYGPDSLALIPTTDVTAYPKNYGTILVTWSGSPGTWDTVRLVRNTYGFALSPDDGDVVFSAALTSGQSGAGTYEDTGTVPNNVGLIPGKFYYYAVFLRDSSTLSWKNIGTAYTFSTKDFGTNDFMWRCLPAIFRAGNPEDVYSSVENSALKKFISIFALETDRYRTDISNLNHRYKVSDVDAQAIPFLLNELGFTYEPSLGVKQARILLGKASYLNKIRGSAKGVQDYIRAFAGYDNVVVLGKNLMLNTNDSSFESTIGKWKVYDSNTHTATVARGTTPTPFQISEGSSNYPVLATGVLKLISGTSGDMEVSCMDLAPITSGIPVAAQTSYVFSAYSRAATSTRAVTAKIFWYDAQGKLISSSTSGTSPTNSTSIWTRVSVVAVSPAGASYAATYLKVASAGATETHYFDACQFEANTAVSEFEDARQVNITVKATRVNELLNPNFEVDYSNWTLGNATAIVTSAEVGEVHVNISDVALEVTTPSTITTTLTANASAGATTITVASTSQVVVGQLLKIASSSHTEYFCVTAVNTGTKVVTLENLTFKGTPGLVNAYSTVGTTVTLGSYMQSSSMAVSLEETYTFSTYNYSPDNNALAFIKIRWLYGAIDVAYSTLSGTTLTAGADWQRLQLTDTAPIGADHAIVEYHFIPSAVSQETYIDAALFEKSPRALPFFDGAHTQGDLNDIKWEGTGNASRSHYYLNYLSALNRLTATLPNWLTYGSVFKLKFYQPGV